MEEEGFPRCDDDPIASMPHTLTDLIEEAKRRAFLLFTCVLGLAYLMSMTSSSVWMNVPVALLLIIAVRCLSHELEAKNKHSKVFNRPSKINCLQYQQLSPFDPLIQSPPSVTDWKKKVDSPIVEAALDSFTGHIVREWLTDLWYSAITPDKDAPQELRELINDLFGEIAQRVKHINLIDLLTRDFVDVIRSHLELYRKAQSHVGCDILRTLTFEERDAKLKLTLSSLKELHPAVISPEAECKVLERLMGGVLAIILRPEYLGCKFVRILSRELLACAVMRPVMNFACPRFINDLIVKSLKKANKEVGAAASENKMIKAPLPLQGTSDVQDRSQSGVELVQLGPSATGSSVSGSVVKKVKESQLEHKSKRSLPPGKELPNMNSETGNVFIQGRENFAIGITGVEHSDVIALKNTNKRVRALEDMVISDKYSTQRHNSAARQIGADDWGQMLEAISKRKTQALAPEHFDNMWTKGRYYKKKEDTNSSVKVAQNLLVPSHVRKDSNTSIHSGKNAIKERIPETMNCSKDDEADSVSSVHDTLVNQSIPDQRDVSHGQKDSDGEKAAMEDLVADSVSEDDESSGTEGFGTPGVKVWGSISSRNAAEASKVRHPLESAETSQRSRRNKTGLRLRKPVRVVSDRQLSKNYGSEIPTWQELQRTSVDQGDGLDILKAGEEKLLEPVTVTREETYSKNVEPVTVTREETDSKNVEFMPPRTSDSESKASSSVCVAHKRSQQLQCRVLGADFVRNGVKILAVYSVLVIDSEDHTWFVKRRFRHFEELHRRLKEYLDYALNLPPKHFLSSNLDTSLVMKRCFQLDKYLQDLLSSPDIVESVEVWDFLSADSQTYGFRNSLSLIKSLTVNLDDEQDEVSLPASEMMEENDGLVGGSRKNHADSNRGFESPRSFIIRSTMKHPDSFQVLTSNDRVANKGIPLSLANVNNSIIEEDGLAVQSQANFDTDSETEGQKLGMWARELDVSGDHDMKTKLKYLEKAVASLSRDCLSRSSSVVSDSVERDDLAVPLEWIPPKLSVPLLNLVDAVFELEARGWIRRQVFWIAKQVLQLGMGDAFDDWMLAKIQYLRTGQVIASTIQWLEQVLWPNGVFITKQQRSQPLESAKTSDSWQSNVGSENSVGIQKQSSQGQQLDAYIDAKKVHELIIENAPTALVSLIGRSQYEQCARDIYFFLQSTTFVKQLAYNLLEVVLLAVFPELNDIVLDIRKMLI